MQFKKLFIPLFFLAVFGFLFNFNAPTAKAMSAAEIQTLIQQLQQQIAQLQSQLTGKEGGEARWCYDFNTNLRIGDSGAGVAELQTVLEREGFSIDSAEKAMTRFDESTASAVVGFQEKYKNEILTPFGLKRGTGFVGKSTRAKLNKLYGCGISSTPSITVLSPNGGEVWQLGKTYTVKWRSSGVDKVTVDVVDQGAPEKCDVTMNQPVSAWNGEYSFLLEKCIGSSGATPPISPGQHKVYVRSSEKPAIFDFSDNSFEIIVASTTQATTTTASITVLSPNGGEVWQLGTTYTVKWQSSGVDKVIIEVVDQGAPEKCDVTMNQPVSASNGEYSFLLEKCIGSSGATPPISPGQYKVYVRSSKESAIFDNSDNNFSIVTATTTATTTINSITVLSPNGGEVWEAGKTYTIKWLSTGIAATNNVQIELSGTSIYRKFIDIVSGSSGTYNWTVPIDLNTSDKYSVSVTCYVCYEANNNQVVADSSDAYFTIHNANTDAFALITPEMVYPVDSQKLAYGPPNGYMFKVKPIAGATEYHFQFIQNGVVVYDNIEANKMNTSGEFAFWPGETGYSWLKEGPVTVKINAFSGKVSSLTKTITIDLVASTVGSATTTASVLDIMGNQLASIAEALKRLAEQIGK